jgi:uncharacterized LabA/DUF88 family protein
MERDGWREPRTAAVYIDGFNLYRRALAGRPELKWLDLEMLCDALLPSFDVVQIRFFSALIRHVEGDDPRAPARQQVYLRALATSPRVSIHLGVFRVDKRWMARSPIELGPDGAPRRVRVRKIEEKGTDVSLAGHMVCDAMRGVADAFVLLSNDSDFESALRLVRSEAGREIGLITPRGRSAAKALLALRPDHVRHVGEGALRDAQFPDVMRDERGAIRRRAAWDVQRPRS